MRLWKAFGGASFFLLWFAIFIGPAAKLLPALNVVLSYRREAGVWFFLIALVHGYLILDGWVRWSVWEFFGYQYIAEIDTYLRVESGFGLANLSGFVALTFALALAATSFDKAVNWLGIQSWKWLHMFSYVVFYLGPCMSSILPLSTTPLHSPELCKGCQPIIRIIHSSITTCLCSSVY